MQERSEVTTPQERHSERGERNDSPRAYYEHLRFHPQREAEFGRLAAMVTNNETYFFRETQQFDLIVSHVLPERRSSLQARRWATTTRRS